MTVKSSVSLTDEQHAVAKALVEAGRYAGVSAVLQQRVDLRRRLEDDDLERLALRDVAARRRVGEFVNAKRMDCRLAEVIGARRRSHGFSA